MRDGRVHVHGRAGSTGSIHGGNTIVLSQAELLVGRDRAGSEHRRKFGAIGEHAHNRGGQFRGRQLEPGNGAGNTSASGLRQQVSIAGDIFAGVGVLHGREFSAKRTVSANWNGAGNEADIRWRAGGGGEPERAVKFFNIWDRAGTHYHAGGLQFSKNGSDREQPSVQRRERCVPGNRPGGYGRSGVECGSAAVDQRIHRKRGRWIELAGTAGGERKDFQRAGDSEWEADDHRAARDTSDRGDEHDDGGEPECELREWGDDGDVGNRGGDSSGGRKRKAGCVVGTRRGEWDGKQRKPVTGGGVLGQRSSGERRCVAERQRDDTELFGDWRDCSGGRGI